MPDPFKLFGISLIVKNEPGNFFAYPEGLAEPVQISVDYP